MTVSRFARADAAYQEEIAAQWRDWVAYLRAHLALLDVRAAEGRVAFERTESLEEREAQARADLAAIPAGRRALFEGVREARRQMTQAGREAEQRAEGGRGRPVDPDAIDREVLEQLLDEAEGREADDGWGYVPIGEDEWYRVDVAALEAAPNAAAYAASRSEADDRQRRLRVLAALVGVAAALLVVWLLLPKGAAPAPVAGVITVNGTPVPAWAPVRLMLAGASERTADLAVVRSATWPASVDVGAAGWRAGALAPLQLCAPADALAGATAARIGSVGDVPERIYVLGAAAEASPDLVLEVCGSGADWRTRYGTLQRAERPTDLALGQPGSLDSDRQIAVERVTLVGPGEDPSVPPDQARVAVAVAAPAGLDWPALAPTLLLATGQALLPGETVTTSGGVELRYLVPLPAEPLEAAWGVTTPDGRHLR